VKKKENNNGKGEEEKRGLVDKTSLKIYAEFIIIKKLL
jgi:hypothetical protein